MQTGDGALFENSQLCLTHSTWVHSIYWVHIDNELIESMIADFYGSVCVHHYRSETHPQRLAVSCVIGQVNLERTGAVFVGWSIPFVWSHEFPLMWTMYILRSCNLIKTMSILYAFIIPMLVWTPFYLIASWDTDKLSWQDVKDMIYQTPSVVSETASTLYEKAIYLVLLFFLNQKHGKLSTTHLICLKHWCVKEISIKRPRISYEFHMRLILMKFLHFISQLVTENELSHTFPLQSDNKDILDILSVFAHNKQIQQNNEIFYYLVPSYRLVLLQYGTNAWRHFALRSNDKDQSPL